VTLTLDRVTYAYHHVALIDLYTKFYSNRTNYKKLFVNGQTDVRTQGRTMSADWLYWVDSVE